MSKKDKKNLEEAVNKANCFIEEDLYQKVKREAKHLGIPPQKLVNTHLREYFTERSKVKKQKRKKEKAEPVDCPQCGYKILGDRGKSINEDSMSKEKGFFSKLFG
tara:strand:+ start:521 stop:835 length:315 start_codon:yes stop_codon:yes gene_type:complete